MRYRLLTFLTFIFVFNSAKAQINTGNPTRPFGSTTSYGYGMMPTNLPSGGTYGKSQNAADAYNTWKANYVVACGGSPVKYRVKFDNPTLTVSEGIAYGMMLAAYAGDKPLFDGLWLYYKSFLTSNGLMNWRISECNYVDGSGAATDADLDAALALRVAMVQWPSETTYSPDLASLVEKIRLYEIQTATEQGPYQTNNGDQWTSTLDCRNPSYQSPAYYKVFANIEPSFSSFWTSAENASYTMLNTNANSSTGLVSNWCNSAGVANACNGPEEYGWDACRFPWRMATDVIWWNTTNAKTRCNALASYVSSTGVPNLKGPVSMSGGNGSYHSPAFVSTWACGLMGASSTYQSTLNAAYTETVNVQDNLPYYFGNTLRAIMIFQMTGNFWNPISTSGCSSLSLNVGSDATVCSGASISRTVSASGGTGPYTYIWNNGLGNGATKTLSPSINTTYVITVSDNAGCTKTSSFIVTINSATANAGADQTICSGNSASLTASGGSTYLWNNGANTVSTTVTPSSNITYIVTVTNGNGCTATDAVNVNVSPALVLNVGSDASICSGASLSRTVSASGGSGTYTYSWSNGLGTGATKTLNPSTNTTYVVTVSDNAGCTKTSSFTITINSASANAGTDQTICLGNLASLTASGGVTYIWSNASTTAAITVSTGGTYTVTVTNANGCTATDAVNVNVNSAIANAGTDQTICLGNSASLTASGGSTYLWNNGANSVSTTVTPSSNTTYTVTVTNGNGCTATDAVNVNVSPALVLNVGSDASICLGASLSRTVSASGGSGSYTYSWSNGLGTGATKTLNPSTNTTYVVTVSDNAGCTKTSSFTITINAASANAGADQVICLGNSASLTASGGVTYIWSNAATTAAITVSTAGTYIVTVTNANGCTATDAVNVNVNSAIANAGADQTICLGNSASLTASGGSTYVWSNAAITASTTVNPVSNTTYTVTVTNSNGCTATDAVNVLVNQLPSIDAGLDESICAGSSLSRTVNASGGTSPYSYTWNNGLGAGATKTLNPVINTTYIVTVSDNAGCTKTSSFVVTVSSVTANAGPDQTICFGSSATLNVSGGSSYIWSDGSTTASITVNPSSSTIYTVTVTNSNNCSATDNVNVNVNAALIGNAGSNATICNGTSVTRTVNASGGVAPYTYAWNNGIGAGATKILTPSTNTTYIVTVSDNLGCTSISSFNIVVNFAPTVNAGADFAICSGSNVIITASGAISYLWSNGATNNSVNVSPSSTTTYTVTGANESGCTSSDDIVVSVNPNPIISAGADQTILVGQSASLTASGNATSYEWNNGETTSSIITSPSATTIYTVIGTSAAGCQSSDNVTVNVNSLILEVGNNENICEGANITRSVNTVGGVAPYTYVWNNGLGTGNSKILNPTTTTTYVITVTDNNNATSTGSFTINVNPVPTVSAGNNVTICTPLSATLIASGAYEYIWNTNATSESISVSPESTTTYSVTGFSLEGCSATSSVIVNVNLGLTLNSGGYAELCQGESLLRTVTSTGGTAPFNYTWNNGLGTGASKTLSPVNNTTYSITASDANGCSSVSTFAINVNPLPIINAGPDQIVQLGQSTTLVATGASNYEWSNGATTSSITVSPTINTTYTVTGSTFFGCTNTDNVNVLINNLVLTVGSNATICQGSSLERTVSSTGGSAPYSYLWNNSLGSGVTKTLNPTSNTTYSITVTDANGYTAAASFDILVNTLPAINAGGDVTIQIGQSTTLSATGAITYLWNNGETTSSISVSPTISTTYTVTGTNVSGCTNTGNVIVTVNILNLNGGGNATICQGNSIMRTVTTTDGIAPFVYTWSNGLGTGDTKTLNPSVTTTYNVTVTDANNNTDTDIIVITVNSNPIASSSANQTICSGTSTILNAGATSGSSPYTYLWNNSLGTGSSKTITPLSTATYNVTVTDYKGCTSSATTVITVATVPTISIIGTSASSSLTVYKEPTTLINGTWNTGGTLTEVTTSAPYQGTKHYQFVPTAPSPVANFGLNMSGWGNTGKNFTGYASLKIAYRGLAGSNIVKIMLRNQAAAPNFSNTVILGGSSSNYTVVDIPMSQFTSNNSFNLANVTEIMIEVTDATPTVTAPLFFDNIELIGLSTTLTPPYTNCGNQGMTFTASGGSTYSWSNGSTTSNINVNPTATTAYTVTATNVNGCTNSQSVSVIGGAGLTVPANVLATDGTLINAVTISWNALPCNFYRVYRNTANTTTGATALGTTWSNLGSFTDNTASPGILYYYWVVASLNTSGSNPSTFSANNTGFATLTAPANVNATDGTSLTNVTINCTAVSGNYFRVYRNTTNSSVGATALGSWSTSNTYNDNTAVAGTVYYYFMVASKYASGTPASAFSSSNTGFRGVTPLVPTSVNATDGTFNSKVRITWTGKAGTFYKVYRNTTNSSAGALEVSGWINTTTFDDATVTLGTVYYYFVRSASNNIGSNITAFSGSNSGFSSSTGSARPNTKNAVNPKIYVYPNPSASDVVVTWEGLENDFVELNVSDANGNIVMKKAIHANAGQNNFTILKSDLPDGVFYVKIVNVNGFVYKTRTMILMDK